MGDGAVPPGSNRRLIPVWVGGSGCGQRWNLTL